MGSPGSSLLPFFVSLTGSSWLRRSQKGTQQGREWTQLFPVASGGVAPGTELKAPTSLCAYLCIKFRAWSIALPRTEEKAPSPWNSGPLPELPNVGNQQGASWAFPWLARKDERNPCVHTNFEVPASSPKSSFSNVRILANGG